MSFENGISTSFQPCVSSRNEVVHSSDAPGPVPPSLISKLIVAGEADRLTGLRRLYVCLTRAVTSLLVLHADDLPEELGAP